MTDCIDECVKKIELREGKKRMWIIINNDNYKSCEGCTFNGVIELRYCRNKKVYDKIIEQQLTLPYKK